MRPISTAPLPAFTAAAAVCILCISGAHLLAAGPKPVATPPAPATRKPVWREDFAVLPAAWQVRKRPGARAAMFRVEQDPKKGTAWLRMEADNATASLVIRLNALDLKAAPMLRWRWRVTELPKGGDGRLPTVDDQAIGIYIQSYEFGVRRTIAYRWETETPVGTEGAVSYAGGLARVKWICLRNKDSANGKFLVETRNVAADFQRLFGYIPKRVGVGISCNSQYTGTRAAAQLDWIEFLPAPAVEAKRTPAHSER